MPRRNDSHLKHEMVPGLGSLHNPKSRVSPKPAPKAGLKCLVLHHCCHCARLQTDKAVATSLRPALLLVLDLAPVIRASLSQGKRLRLDCVLEA